MSKHEHELAAYQSLLDAAKAQHEGLKSQIAEAQGAQMALRLACERLPQLRQLAKQDYEEGVFAKLLETESPMDAVYAYMKRVCDRADNIVQSLTMNTERQRVVLEGRALQQGHQIRELERRLAQAQQSIDHPKDPLAAADDIKRRRQEAKETTPEAPAGPQEAISASTKDPGPKPKKKAATKRPRKTKRAANAG